MANIIRLAKSGSNWSTNELIAYKISIVERDQNTFFNGPLPAYTGPTGFVQYEDRVQGLDAPSLALIKRLDLAMKAMDGEESAVDDFTIQLLWVLGYETEQNVVRSRKHIPLSMCGEQVYTKTDVCVLNVDFEILLVQEDTSHINPTNPEPQLVAAAIAAFQANNFNRVNFRLIDPLPKQVIPGIIMEGTFPRFYKIEVTADLDMCVRGGTYPATRTIVERHTPRVPSRRSDGMKPLDNRILILQCYEAFKQFVL
ncbi:hypothetical protein BU17DRAFT_39503 [Hysterangium stoloniferum]|nr:hypothetical protein BU17DRAFT_39503 [Hysterangium stoloniferum]